MGKGTIKKIDELGRIVIPKDIRKSLSIKTNDALEIAIVGNSINIEKNISIKNYDIVAKKYADLFSKCNITLIVSNREKIIFNNSDIDYLNISELVNLSLYELIEKKQSICAYCDIRPIIIDSNPEGIVIILKSSCNELIGQLFNMLVTNELDISC
jgi:transcriptional pleiotropic regulator of transition state genes